MDSREQFDDASCAAWEALNIAFRNVMHLTPNMTPEDVAFDLVETFIQDAAHREPIRTISPELEAIIDGDELMAFVASRDEMPTMRHDDEHVRPLADHIGRRVRLSIDDPNGTHTMTGVVVDVDDTRLLLTTRRRNKPIPLRFIRTITDITKPATTETI